MEYLTATEFLSEEYFFNSFNRGNKTFFGENFDYIYKNLYGVKGGMEGEYDVVLINCTSIGIIETKYRGRDNDYRQILKIPQSFRDIFQHYANHKIYLGYAAFSFKKETEQFYIDNGIAIIKQVGDTIIIQDEHLKTF